MQNFEDILPLSKVEHQVILSAQGDITLGYELRLPELFILSAQDFENLHQLWIKAIKLLPQGMILCKQDWFTQAHVQADFNQQAEDFLSLSSERFFHERPFLDHRCYLYATAKVAKRKAASSALSGIFRKHLVPQQLLDPQLLEQLESHLSQFARVVQDSGLVGIRRLTDFELAGDRNHGGLIEQYCTLSLSQPPILSDLQIKGELKIGNAYCQLYTLSDVEDLPALCGSRMNYDPYSSDQSVFSQCFAAPLSMHLDCDHLYSQYLFLEDAPATIKKLEAKKLRLQSLSAYSRENGLAAEAVDDFLNESIGQQRQPLKAHFNVLVWAQDKSQLTEIKNKVSAAMARMDATPRLENVGAPQIWWAGIPGNAADFPMNDTFNTFIEQACCFLNQESASRSSPSPFGMRMADRLSGRPLHVDISDEPMKRGWITNRSKFILGPSGSGKSFFTNHMMRSYHAQGAHIMIIDIGHSYQGLCELVGGYYFTYSEENPIRFNPFYLSAEDSLDTEKRESIKTLLLALWKKDDEPFRRSEYVAISGALTAYYDYLDVHTQEFACFDSFYEFLSVEYEQMLLVSGVKERDFDLGNFLYVLRPYYKGGEFDYLLNASENLNLLHERFIVMELDNVKDHPILFPVVTLIIMEMIVSKMRKLPGQRKVVLIEEAWKAIARQGMAEHIKYLWKTMRKFYGEPIVVTQEVEDIISSPVVRNAIINNSDCKILLDQSKYQNKFEQIQQLLGLTDKEKTLALSLNRANDPSKKYKEVFISLGSQHSRVYRTEVSLEEYFCYSTEESEKLRVREYARRYGSMKKGIEMLAAEVRAKN